MNLLEQIRVALRALSTNKLRSALTMLGIIIGVGAVITLLSVGEGVQNLVTNQLQSIGTNILFVIPGNLTDAARQRGSRASNDLTIKDAEAIADPFNVPDVIAIAPVLMSSAEVSYSKTTLGVSVSGVTPAYEEVRNSPVQYGSFIGETDYNTRSRVAVLGSRVAQRLFEDQGLYPIGASIKINNVPFKVIGVLESKGGGGMGMGGGNQDDVVLVPLTTAHQRLFQRFFNRQGEPLISILYTQVISEDRMDAASNEISDLLRRRHDIKFQDQDDFTVINQRDLLAIFGRLPRY